MGLEDIRKTFVLILGLMTIAGLFMVITTTNWSDTKESTKSLEGAVTKIVPTDISWISIAADKLKNHPLILTVVIFGIIWLFYGAAAFKGR